MPRRCLLGADSLEPPHATASPHWPMPKAGKRRRYPTGIRPWKGGWQAYVQVHGQTQYKSYPRLTEFQEMKDWRQQQKEQGKTLTPTRGSFAADIAHYLARIAAIPSHAQFKAYLELWAIALGRDRPRRSIRAGEIDAVLQRWEQEGASPTVLRKRRMVLMALWNRLDGKQAVNPVRGTRAPQVPKPEARGLPYPTVKAILAQLRDSATKRRLDVIAHTGLPPSMLMQVTAADLDLTAGTVRVRPRRKGHGVEARTLYLIPDGVRAFRAFADADTFGRFAGAAANRVFQRAAALVGVRGVHLYDLRHSFGAALYLATRDLATVSRFLLHSTPLLTARYAQSAMQDVDKAAAAALGRNLSLKPAPKNKARGQKHLRRVS